MTLPAPRRLVLPVAANALLAFGALTAVSLSAHAQPASPAASAAASAADAARTKDIVIDRITAPILPGAPGAPGAPGTPGAAASDAMSISVLLESLDGTLVPRSTNAAFRTGERFRVRVLASREGKVSFYNTNPLGVFNPTPVWQGTVVPGQETISPRLVLTGNSGVDQLHVVLEPTESGPQGVIGWLQGLLRQARDVVTGKDIRLDVAHTPQYSYVINPDGQGLQSTIRIAHR